MANVKNEQKNTGKAGSRGKKASRPASEAPMRAKSTGAVLSPEAEAILLAEAEAGYDPDALVPRRAPGRPSLSARGGTSHRINVRVDDEIYDVLQRVARDTGRKPSELVREVLRAAYGPKTS
jgi:hypothetical protein